MPFINGILREALSHVLPTVRLVTVITDLESSTAHRWLEPYDATAINHIVVRSTLLRRAPSRLIHDKTTACCSHAGGRRCSFARAGE